MGAAVAWCGRSLSAWPAVEHTRRRLVSPDRVTDHSFRQVGVGSVKSPYSALRGLFAPSQRRFTLDGLNGDMPQATRVEAGRRRARAAKRAVTITAAAGFVVLLAVARQGHPAAGTSTTPTSNSSVSQSSGSSSSLESGSSLGGGGSIAPSSGGSPPVASQTS
jgi:hypothetical protein